jgi:hypothetical protein
MVHSQQQLSCELLCTVQTACENEHPLIWAPARHEYATLQDMCVQITPTTTAAAAAAAVTTQPASVTPAAASWQ